MLTIIAPDTWQGDLAAVLARYDRLDELVSLASTLPDGHAATLRVDSDGISFALDWQRMLPPYIFPEHVPYTPERLLGLVFMYLGNYERTYELLEASPALLQEVDIVNRLQQGIEVSPAELSVEYAPFDEYRLMHNQAILRHYGSAETQAEEVHYFYQEAMLAAPDADYMTFSAWHYATLLTDLGMLGEAAQLLDTALRKAVSAGARTELRAAQCAVWMRQLAVPYDAALLDKLKQQLWELLQVYEQQTRQVELALLLVDAAQIANISQSFAESLAYVNRAIDLLRREEQPALLAQAQYRKGVLLYTWAKNGQPQFFRAAMEAYQEALKVFTRANAPLVFAEIHHHLGVIYSEIPDEVKRKRVWAAVSSSSFQEALRIYTKEAYPYEYAMVCNSYGNALTKYPAALRSDNYQQALAYYQEALDVRRADTYPLERALTLLNHIEACWYAENDADTFNEGRYLDMLAKAREVKDLVDDPALLADADRHLAQLAALRQLYH
ncbi:MAG: hypothetical protein OHK0039_26740 [Bacteroidia bacterium]